MSQFRPVDKSVDGNVSPAGNTSKSALDVAQAIAAGGTGQDVNTTNALLALVNLLITEKADAVQERQKAQELVAVRDAQRTRTSKDMDANVRLKQAMCKHLKGGRRGPKNQGEDYAVSQHVFIDSTTYIKCHICSMKWRPKDTAEFLLRNGKQIPNHTRVGWAEAKRMQSKSTNEITMSERVLNATPAVGAADKPQIAVTESGDVVLPSIVDRDGNTVTNVEL